MRRLDRTSLPHTLLTYVGIATVVITTGGSAHQAAPIPPARSPSPPHAAPVNDYDDSARSLTDQERVGRDTWNFWTAGDEKLWRRIAILTHGDVD